MRDPERVALAERLATLINAGDCAQALTIVEAARDADMAGNVDDACKIDPTARGG